MVIGVVVYTVNLRDFKMPISVNGNDENFTFMTFLKCELRDDDKSFPSHPIAQPNDFTFTIKL